MQGHWVGLAHNSPVIESTGALHFRWRWWNSHCNLISCWCAGGAQCTGVVLYWWWWLMELLELLSSLGTSLFEEEHYSFLFAPPLLLDDNFPHNSDFWGTSSAALLAYHFWNIQPPYPEICQSTSVVGGGGGVGERRVTSSFCWWCGGRGSCP